ncbi:MAG TPA: ATP-binding protein, partial [Lacipirellulaceae bacterium]|nr:ATP-binding protein [Lacipirellulaceae bacterium]
MYTEYWQLAAKPFEPSADRTAYYPCESHEGAVLKLRYAVENRRGAVVLAGPAGVGKTMLVQILRSELPETVGPRVHLVFPQMSSRDLLVYLAEQIGAPPADPPRQTVEESVRRLEFFLGQNANQGRHALVVIDEAHLLEDCGALETLRLMLNFESAGRPLLTLILVGQMGLISSISRLPSLDERVAVKALLRAFTPQETDGYVRRRLELAGA